MSAAAASALIDTELDPVATFPAARGVHPHAGEQLPWSEEAILWLPGEPPLFGRWQIETRLNLDPGLRPVALGGSVEFAPTEDYALECGHGRRSGQTLRYWRVWRRRLVGEWQVVREVWTGSDSPGSSVQTWGPKPV